MIDTPIGLVPHTLEDLNPFCHIEGSSWLWDNKLDMVKVTSSLESLGLNGRSILPIDLRNEKFEANVYEKLERYLDKSEVELIEGKITVSDSKSISRMYCET